MASNNTPSPPRSRNPSGSPTRTPVDQRASPSQVERQNRDALNREFWRRQREFRGLRNARDPVARGYLDWRAAEEGPHVSPDSGYGTIPTPELLELVEANDPALLFEDANVPGDTSPVLASPRRAYIGVVNQFNFNIGNASPNQPLVVNNKEEEEVVEQRDNRRARRLGAVGASPYLASPDQERRRGYAMGYTPVTDGMSTLMLDDSSDMTQQGIIHSISPLAESPAQGSAQNRIWAPELDHTFTPSPYTQDSQEEYGMPAMTDFGQYTYTSPGLISPQELFSQGYGNQHAMGSAQAHYAQSSPGSVVVPYTSSPQGYGYEFALPSPQAFFAQGFANQNAVVSPPSMASQQASTDRGSPASINSLSASTSQGYAIASPAMNSPQAFFAQGSLASSNSPKAASPQGYSNQYGYINPAVSSPQSSPASTLDPYASFAQNFATSRLAPNISSPQGYAQLYSVSSPGGSSPQAYPQSSPAAAAVPQSNRNFDLSYFFGGQIGPFAECSPLNFVEVASQSGSDQFRLSSSALENSQAGSSQGVVQLWPPEEDYTFTPSDRQLPAAVSEEMSGVGSLPASPIRSPAAAAAAPQCSPASAVQRCPTPPQASPGSPVKLPSPPQGSPGAMQLPSPPQEEPCRARPRSRSPSPQRQKSKTKRQLFE